MKSDLTGKTAVVIGGTKGIGKELTKLLSRAGFSVVVVGRTKKVGEEIEREFGVHFLQADVSLLSEVIRVAEIIKQKLPSIDLLVHSADILITKRRNTNEGLELTFATNFLSRVLFNRLLLENLKESELKRIVHIAAAGMPGKVDLENVPPLAGTSGFAGHNNGQRANDMYGVDFNERHSSLGVKLLVLNPGMVDTGIRNSSDDGLGMLAKLFIKTISSIVKATPADEYAKVAFDLAISSSPNGTHFNPKGKSISVARHQLDEKRRKVMMEKVDQVLNKFVKA